MSEIAWLVGEDKVYVVLKMASARGLCMGANWLAILLVIIPRELRRRSIWGQQGQNSTAALDLGAGKASVVT